jgi:hypothetical protein
LSLVAFPFLLFVCHVIIPVSAPFSSFILHFLHPCCLFFCFSIPFIPLPHFSIYIYTLSAFVSPYPSVCKIWFMVLPFISNGRRQMTLFLCPSSSMVNTPRWHIAYM